MRKRHRTVTKTGESSDPAKESTGDSGVKCGEKKKTKCLTHKKVLPHTVLLGIKLLKKAQARFLKKLEIGRKEVPHQGPNVESHTDTTSMQIVDLPQKSLVKESIKFNS